MLLAAAPDLCFLFHLKPRGRRQAPERVEGSAGLSIKREARGLEVPFPAHPSAWPRMRGPGGLGSCRLGNGDRGLGRCVHSCRIFWPSSIGRQPLWCSLRPKLRDMSRSWPGLVEPFPGSSAGGGGDNRGAEPERPETEGVSPGSGQPRPDGHHPGG